MLNDLLVVESTLEPLIFQKILQCHDWNTPVFPRTWGVFIKFVLDEQLDDSTWRSKILMMG